jgi:hypothetical protein
MENLEIESDEYTGECLLAVWVKNNMNFQLGKDHFVQALFKWKMC